MYRLRAHPGDAGGPPPHSRSVGPTLARLSTAAPRAGVAVLPQLPPWRHRGSHRRLPLSVEGNDRMAGGPDHDLTVEQVSALHGAQVEVTVLEVQMAEDCLSTSYLR